MGPRIQQRKVQPAEEVSGYEPKTEERRSVEAGGGDQKE